MIQVQCRHCTLVRLLGPSSPPKTGVVGLLGMTSKVEVSRKTVHKKKKIEEGGTKLLFWANLVLSGVSSQFWIYPLPAPSLLLKFNIFVKYCQKTIMQIY